MYIKINVFPLTTWSKVWVNRLYVTVCAFIHLEVGTLLHNWAWQDLNQTQLYQNLPLPKFTLLPLQYMYQV